MMDKKMTIQEIFGLVGDMNTQVAGRYFEERGFETTRLDEEDNQLRNCDWLVEPPGLPFLCEVKTIVSVQRAESTEEDFRRQFENTARHYFGNRKDLQHLPYHLHFHSDSLRLPNGTDSNYATNKCLDSVAEKLLSLHKRKERIGFLLVNDCCDGIFDLAISPSWSGQIQLEVSKYGGLNLERIQKSLSDAIKQVNRSGEDYPNIPRMVMLAFASNIFVTSNSEVAVFNGLAFKEEELWKLIDRVIKRHPELGAIAVMARQTNPHFAVFHNSKVSEAQALDSEIFKDGRSVQFDSLETIPRSVPQPFDLQKITEKMIAEAIQPSEKHTITLADYKALRDGKR